MMKRITVLTLAATFALSGCITDPVTGQQTISKTALFGLGGAAACGAIGAITHGSKGARNAALGCGVVGAGVGGYMDLQERRLRQELANTPVEVERKGDQIKLTMPSGVTFATNSASLSPDAVNSLNTVANVLTQYPETTITVAGYLTGRGVAASRISTVGYGSRSPVADNSTESGRAQNRRVEILINPTTQAGQ